MALSIEDKKKIVSDVNELANNASSLVLADARGLKVSEANELRSEGFKSNVKFRVAKNTLVKLAIREKDTLKNEKKDFLVRKFDLINTWQGSLLYFFILVLTIFILKRYFILNVNVIEIQSIENQIIDK